MKIYVQQSLTWPYVDSVTIEDIHVILDTGAIIKVLLKDEVNTELTSRTLEMGEEDYALWGVDDDWVREWVLDELDLLEYIEEGYEGSSEGYGE